MASRVTRRFDQADCPVSEQVELALGELPTDFRAIEILADVAGSERRVSGEGGLEFARVNHRCSAQEVAERASVIDVQVGLDEIADGLWRYAEPAQLGRTVLSF
jgi:hypothetical protein